MVPLGEGAPKSTDRDAAMMRQMGKKQQLRVCSPASFTSLWLNVIKANLRLLSHAGSLVDAVGILGSCGFVSIRPHSHGMHRADKT